VLTPLDGKLFTDLQMPDPLVVRRAAPLSGQGG
jgi:hypothetical protein